MEREKKTCESCGYFRRHYLLNWGYMPIQAGHCARALRNKHRRPHTPACRRWMPQTDSYRRQFQPPD